jgi:putative peptide zinc metalloprotease protein
MGIWDRLPLVRTRDDLWNQLAISLLEPVELGPDRGVWGQITIPPGGLWRAVNDETLILRHPKKSLWTRLLYDTPISYSANVMNLWDKIPIPEAASPNESIVQSTGLWEKAKEETLIIKRVTTASVYRMPLIRNLANFKPHRAHGWALKELQDSDGTTYWVLKNIRTGIYIRLNEHQRYLWDLLDGSASVQDLAVSSFMKFGTFSVDWLAKYLGQLQAKGFLIQENVDVYRGAEEKLKRDTLWYQVKRIVRILFQSEFNLPVERFFTTLYRGGLKLLYTSAAQLILLVITLMGIPAFVYAALRSRLTLFDNAEPSTVAGGVLGLIIAQVIIFFIHESGHALTTIHYGRQVRRGGVGLYFGMIAFFIDTTDIWMEPRKPRLAVTWAGPYTGFIMSSIASLLLFAFPGAAWASFAYQFASLGYFISLTNLNPLIKLDGYYLLMDWLEMPMLRERSITFVRKGLWEKLRSRQRLGREEAFFIVFGTLSLGFSVFTIYLFLAFYGRIIVEWLTTLVELIS